MTALAADLVDGVIPFVPVRQFVLSLPHRLRYMLAYDHDRCTAVLRIFIRALMSFYHRRARKRGVSNGRTGSITFIQRFGSAANLNLHFHVIVLDGVFAEQECVFRSTRALVPVHPGSRSVATGLYPIGASATGVVSWGPCRP